MFNKDFVKRNSRKINISVKTIILHENTVINRYYLKILGLFKNPC